MLDRALTCSYSCSAVCQRARMRRDAAARERMALLRADDMGAYLRAAQSTHIGRLAELLAGTDACLRTLARRLGSLALCSRTSSSGDGAMAAVAAAPAAGSGGENDGVHACCLLAHPGSSMERAACEWTALMWLSAYRWHTRLFEQTCMLFQALAEYSSRSVLPQLTLGEASAASASAGGGLMALHESSSRWNSLSDNMRAHIPQQPAMLQGGQLREYQLEVCWACFMLSI